MSEKKTSTMLSDIWKIPDQAMHCLENNQSLTLPDEVLYLGMGSSFYAALTLKYAGAEISPELASEFFNYKKKSVAKNSRAVLISQSGRSSETVWCAGLFDQYISITNVLKSPLATGKGCIKSILIEAGEEVYSATKSYINTLVVLYQGLGFFAVKEAIKNIQYRMKEFEKIGRKLADGLYSDLKDKKNNCGDYKDGNSKNRTCKGICILGSGPNWATALQGSLIFTESTKYIFTGMSTAQFDHGPKEAAKNAIVIIINTNGPVCTRTSNLITKLSDFGTKIYVIEEYELAEEFSPLAIIISLNFAAYYLSENLGIKKTFILGDKVTEVKE